MSKILKRWPPFADPISNEKFDLSHLSSIRIRIVQPATKDQEEKYFTGFIGFSHHCFTRTPGDDEVFSEGQIYLEPNNERRLFCRDRYELSRSVLVDTVNQKLTDGSTKCFHTNRGNFMLLESVDKEDNPVSYEMYFDIYASNIKDVDVYIRMNSAFIRNSRQQKRIKNISRIRLDTIAFKTIRGEPLPTRRSGHRPSRRR